MDRMAKDQRVGVKTNELDKEGQVVPPRFFGQVIEAAEDGLSGYVCLDGAEPGEGDRVFFHCTELDAALPA